MMPQEAHQTAEVIVVAVAQHESVERTRINAEEIDVVD
jgi:hypothetical protein